MVLLHQCMQLAVHGHSPLLEERQVAWQMMQTP